MPLTLLLVQNAEVREGLRRQLENTGHAVALSHADLAGARPDLVICDDEIGTRETQAPVVLLSRRARKLASAMALNAAPA
jgi:hypothetical protein